MRWWLLFIVTALVLGVGMSAMGADQSNLKYRWMFVWRDLTNPAEVDKLLADLPRAAEAGYNGLLLRWNVAPEKKQQLKDAAAKYHFDLIPTVMGGVPDKNLLEGLPVKDAVFIAQHGTATLAPDAAAVLPGGDFEKATGDTFAGWDSQEKPGTCTFRDTKIKHGGQASIRMENLDKSGRDSGCYVGKEITVIPYRQYRVSVWIKTDGLKGGMPDVNIRGLGKTWRGLCYTNVEIEPTQDWRQYFFIFNSLDNTGVRLSFGVWDGQQGRVWWDDAKIEEVGLMNVLRRKGTPVVVKAENGTVYEEGKDYTPISDPNFHIWLGGHEQPVIHLTENSRIQDGARLLVSYYHPVLIEYGAATCLSDPKVFEYYRAEITRVNDELHPPAFFMSHDEIRLANWCETCRSKHETPGQLLAENVKQCAEIIHALRPDVKIWVWNDMFDPFHNAHENYYLVNGTWAASWEGLPKYVGIGNWANHLAGKNLYFFSMRGHEQILCGYYDNPADNDGSRMQAWLKAGEGIPGIVGAMYTTWQPNYEPLITWAHGVWGEKAQ